MAEVTARQREEIHRQRCEEQGHDWENCASIFMQVYQRCKWCGVVSPGLSYPR